MVKNLGVEANFVILLDLFDGDIFKALEKSRKHNHIKVTMSAKTVERFLIRFLIKAGWSNKQIYNALKSDDREISRYMIKSARREING